MKLLFIFLLFSITITFSQTWEIYNTGNSNILSNDIKSLDIDSHGNPWVVTPLGVSTLQNGQWINYKNEDLVNKNVSFTQIQISEGLIFLSGYESDGIYRGIVNDLSKFLDVYKVQLLRSIDTNSILFTSNNEFFSFKNKELKKIDDVPYNLTDILYSKKNVIWYTSEFDSGGVYNDKQGKLPLDNYLYPYVYAIVEDKDNNIWITTGGRRTVQKLNISSSTWKIFDTTDSPISKWSTLPDIQIDSANNIWVLDRYLINPKDNFLLKYDHKEWIKYTFSDFFKDNPDIFFLTNSLAIDSKNNVWIGSNQGLIKFNEAKTTVSTFKENNIKLYPNPTNDILYIDLSDKNVLSYSITDITGKILKQDFHNFTKQITIDTKPLTAGTYFIKLNLSDNHTIQSKFVKE